MEERFAKYYTVILFLSITRDGSGNYDEFHLLFDWQWPKLQKFISLFCAKIKPHTQSSHACEQKLRTFSDHSDLSQ